MQYPCLTMNSDHVILVALKSHFGTSKFRDITEYFNIFSLLFNNKNITKL